MSIINRVWRRLSGGDAAERAEHAGELARAAQLWAASGEVDEAARVMLLRGDAEPDPKLRLQHYTQAAAIASEGRPVQTTARVKRARLVAALAAGGALSAALRRDVIEAAAELEKAGEWTAAADAYALAGDTEGEARACASAGDTERLEALLSRDHKKTVTARAAHDVQADIDALIGEGRRREALALAERSPEDPLAKSRVARLRGARTSGPIVRLTLHGRRLVLVLGAEVTIGRTEGAITVASSALSRRHVQLTRRANGGAFVAKDLDSRNGTQLRALNVVNELAVGDGVALTLGGEVPLALAPSKELADALAIEVGGETYVAQLASGGGALLGIATWRLEQAADGWVELVCDGGAPAFTGGLVLASRMTLLRGDALSVARGGEVVLRVEG